MTAAIVLAMVLGTGVLPAAAAPNDIPVAPRNVVVFPQRDFVEAEGFAPQEQVEVRVLRPDEDGGDPVLIGSASGTTDADGALEVNHPGGECWDGATPDLLGGDVVQVLTDATPGAEEGEATTTQRVTAQRAYIDGTTVVVHGTASDGRGGRLPIDLLEQRIINPAFTETDIGRRDIRATADGTALGTLAYDSPTATTWTARYTRLDAEQRELAVEGQTRVLAWQHFDGVNRQGITIYEEDEVNGPGMGGCPASASWAVTATTPSAVNLATVDEGLRVSGTSHRSTAVTVTVDDTDPATPALQASVTPAGADAQRFSAAFTSEQVRGLRDGVLTASATHTVDGGRIAGASRTLLKDLVAPAAPRAEPGGGTYPSAQSVRLTNDEALPVHHTVDGTAPGADDPVHRRALRITADQTLRAVAIDAAGNTSPVTSEAYVIEGARVDAEPPAVAPAEPDPGPGPRTITEPPLAPRNVVVFPMRDFVGAEGFPAGQSLTFRVVRAGAVVGTARGTTDATGLLEVNHPGGVCWDGMTPDIRAGDVVEVLHDTTTGHEQGSATSTAFVTAEPAVIEGGVVVVRGTAATADGRRLDLGRVEQRIINPAFKGTSIGRRDIRALADGSGRGTLGYDDATTTSWTARYTGLTAQQQQMAVDGQTRVLAWQQLTTDRQGLTIYEADEVGGPGMGGCPDAADHGVVAASPAAVNIANQGAGLTLSGVATGATTVEATLTDGTTTVTADADLRTRGDAQVWTAGFSAGQIAELDEGTLTAAARSATADGPVDGVTLEILKDLTAPAAPTVTPGSGVYAAEQAITLSNPVEKALAIHYTTDNTNPHADDPRADGQLSLSRATTLRAVAIDVAGNESGQTVASFGFAIPVPQTPTLRLADASDSGTKGDGITNVNRPTFQGTAPAGTTVVLRADGVQVATAAVTAGSWAATLGLRPDGEATYTAVAVDAGGRESAAASLVVRIDTTRPTTMITAAPSQTTRDPAFSFSASEASAAECSMSTGADAYAPCTSPKQYTSLADGTYTFKVRVTDTAGNVSTVASMQHILDATAPAVTAPALSIVNGARPTTAAGIPVRLTWSGTDAGTGIAFWELQRYENGVLRSEQRLDLAVTAQSLTLQPGVRYEFRVRATDRAGNAAAFATRGPLNLTADQETSGSIVYRNSATSTSTTSWTTATQAGSYGGSVRHASAAGPRATYTFRGSTVAWVSTLSTDRGRAEVWLDGVRVATVELHADSTRAGEVVYVNNNVPNPTQTHTLEVRVLGAKLGKSKGTRVDVDAFLSTPAP